MHFTGQDWDSESNLTHFMFRQLSTTEGRWITPDPAGMGAVSPGDPQTWNRYAYVGNNPLNVTDPLGLHGASINGIDASCAVVSNFASAGGAASLVCCAQIVSAAMPGLAVAGM